MFLLGLQRNARVDSRNDGDEIVDSTRKEASETYAQKVCTRYIVKDKDRDRTTAQKKVYQDFMGFSRFYGAQKRHRDKLEQNPGYYEHQASIDKEATPISIGKDQLPEAFHLKLEW